MRKKLFLLFFIITFNSYAVSSFWVGGGTLTHNFLKSQKDIKGGTTVINFSPVVFAGLNLPFIFSGSNFVPALGYSYSSAKDNSSKSELIFQAHANQDMLSSIYLFYGFSTYMTKIGGDGSSVQLNNGNGYSTFYAPSETKTSYTSSLDIGGEFIISSEMSAKMQFSLMRFLSSDRRSVSHILTFNYFL